MTSPKETGTRIQPGRPLDSRLRGNDDGWVCGLGSNPSVTNRTEHSGGSHPAVRQSTLLFAYHLSGADGEDCMEASTWSAVPGNVYQRQGVIVPL